MPKSFMYTARDYREGSDYSGNEYNKDVMLTRSGLSIKKVTSDTKSSMVLLPTAQVDDEKTDLAKKQCKTKQKSLNHMSFVTRVHLCHKVKDIGFPGISRKISASSNEVFSRAETTVYEDDDHTTENDVGTDLDSFILTMAETIDEKKKTITFEEIMEKRIEWMNSSRESVPSSTRTGVCPLTTYFANNRLPDGPSACTLSDDVNGTNQENEFQANNNNFVDIDSEDTSSIGSEVFYDFDSAPLLQVSKDAASPASSSLTKILKLRDVELKIHFVDGYGGEKLIKCGECEKVFTVMSAYMSHLRSHMKSKSTCFLCGKVFSRSWLLTGHLRTHTGEKPFMCPHDGCSKSFADKSNMRSHMLIHNVTNKDYKCVACGRCFAQKRYLHKHMLEVCRANH